jgi:hypothetical protein
VTVRGIPIKHPSLFREAQEFQQIGGNSVERNATPIPVHIEKLTST